MIDPADIELIHNNVDFRRLSRSRILITGGTGFVGKWMAQAPLHLVVLSRAMYESSGWESHAWNYIIHLAPAPVDRVIEVARRAGATILYASSGAVYDREPNDYARGKIKAEARLLASGLPVKIARLFSFSGPYCHHAAAQMALDALQLGVIHYNQHVTRSYLYAADMSVWLWNILLNGVNGGVYEVGGTEPVTMARLAKEIHKRVPGATLQPFQQEDPRPRYLPARAKETMLELCVKEYTSFEDGIAKTAKHYREGLEG